MLFTNRRTKIVATLGPATDRPGILEKLIEAGMDVARLNFSHGTHEDNGMRIRRLRQAARKAGKPVAVLMDLQGPKVRTGRLQDGKPVRLRTGQMLTLTTQSVLGTKDLVSVSYNGLTHDVDPNDRIMLDDGSIELRVQEVRNKSVIATVLHGGSLGEFKGVNLPGLRRGQPGLTAKDRRDLEYGLSQEVDFVALSFVRNRSDIERIRQFFKKRDATVPVIAKIEKREAVQNLDAIIEASDGVMVARGDLGVEMSVKEVPILQKEIIAKANVAGVAVITATQMLETMVEHPRPTRAEASDVANAVYDGTDALMLSGETARGAYPVESVRTMAEIAQTTEHSLPDTNGAGKLVAAGADDFTLAAVLSAGFAARTARARAILVYTMSGRTALLLSKTKPGVPIIALTPSQAACRRCALYRGVTPIITRHAKNTDRMIADGQAAVLEQRLLRRGDPCVIVCGLQRHLGATNMVRLNRLGE